MAESTLQGRLDHVRAGIGLNVVGARPLRVVQAESRDAMWRDQILALCPSAEFGALCSTDELTAVQAALGAKLPLALRDLLLECDGVHGDYGLGLVWSAARCRTDNLHFRTNADFRELYMPFDSLLFFADAGNGDQFAFPVVGGSVKDDVFAWNHEDDSRTWVAPSLQLYLDWWLTGRIKL